MDITRGHRAMAIAWVCTRCGKPANMCTCNDPVDYLDADYYNEWQLRVEEYCARFNLVFGMTPMLRNPDAISVDVMEQAHRLDSALYNNDFEDTLEQVSLLLFTLIGACVSMGVNINPFFVEIFRSQMTKTKTDKGIVKGEHYSAPDIRGILRKMIP